MMNRDRSRQARAWMCATAAAGALLFTGPLAYAQIPPGCNLDSLRTGISFPASLASVECGTSVPFTVEVDNGSLGGSCTVSDLPVIFSCSDPATGNPTGPSTILATADDFPAVPTTAVTYPPVNCVIGDTSGEVCTCGTAVNGFYQVLLHAGPGIVELNPARVDIIDIIKTVSVHCIGPTITPAPHFQCYGTRSQTTDPTAVTLVDEFGTWSLSTRRAERLCAPADKNGENPGAPQAPGHLVGYDLRDTGVAFPSQRDLEVTNQFGSIHVDATRFSRLLVPAAKSLAAPPPLASTSLDHFLCYQVRRTSGSAKFVAVPGVQLIDQFGPKTVTVVKPRLLCNPVNKNGESPGAETHATHLLCYDVKVSREKLDISPVFTNDQFGPRELELIQRDELCVPSTRIR